MCALPGLPRNTRRGEPSLHWQKGLAQLGGCDAWDVRPIARDARATKRSRSCYRREECDEAVYLIEVILELGFVTEKRTKELLQEANEILAITVSSIKTARKKKEA